MNKDNFTQFGSELVLAMAKALVNQPEQVTVEVESGEFTTVFCLTMAPGEMGQVLGKQGSNAAAMRKILQGYATKSRRRAVLEIIDPASIQAPLQEAA